MFDKMRNIRAAYEFHKIVAELKELFNCHESSVMDADENITSIGLKPKTRDGLDLVNIKVEKRLKELDYDFQLADYNLNGVKIGDTYFITDWNMAIVVLTNNQFKDLDKSATISITLYKSDKLFKDTFDAFRVKGKLDLNSILNADTPEYNFVKAFIERVIKSYSFYHIDGAVIALIYKHVNSEKFAALDIKALLHDYEVSILNSTANEGNCAIVASNINVIILKQGTDIYIDIYRTDGHFINAATELIDDYDTL